MGPSRLNIFRFIFNHILRIKSEKHSGYIDFHLNSIRIEFEHKFQKLIQSFQDAAVKFRKFISSTGIHYY